MGTGEESNIAGVLLRRITPVPSESKESSPFFEITKGSSSVRIEVSTGSKKETSREQRVYKDKSISRLHWDRRQLVVFCARVPIELSSVRFWAARVILNHLPEGVI